MPVRERTLRVYPNPWGFIDHRGKAAGVVRLDYHEHNTNRAWVGARIKTATKTKEAVAEVIRGKVFRSGSDSHDIEWEFDSAPVEIPNSAYYRDAIATGQLVAADKATAVAAGIRAGDFEDPSRHLEKLKAAAIADFDAHNGEGAYAALNAIAAEQVEAEKPEPAPAQPTTKSTKSDQPKGDA